ncbi:MAG: GNAT family N-acetyltransferase [Clostridia bacterium]|nr:GNAT family N-acetyltransferase [Clostridia bacterium]MDY3785678.1 GNAT family N-acetyltransferase [Eubacteriales bacterium]
MENKFVNITESNIDREHLCCIIRSKKPHKGIEVKRSWLAERIKEGHIFRKLDVNGCAFIEYAPLNKAWVPIISDNNDFYYIYCLWVTGEQKGHGYGKALMEHCISDAKSKKLSGICMLGAKKQKAWLSDQDFAKKYGFMVIDTAGEYELLALIFDENIKAGDNMPHFTDNAKKQVIENKGLVVYYDCQCPYIPGRIEKLSEYCLQNNINADFVEVNTLEQAKALPCVFNNWAVFYNGNFITVNQTDGAALEKLMKKVRE